MNEQTGRYSVSFLSGLPKPLKTTKPVSDLQEGTWVNDTTVCRLADELTVRSFQIACKD